MKILHAFIDIGSIFNFKIIYFAEKKNFSSVSILAPVQIRLFVHIFAINAQTV
jgi:hypothetical protein